MLFIGSFLLIGCSQSIVTAREPSKVKKFEDLKPKEIKNIQKALGWDDYLKNTCHLRYKANERVSIISKQRGYKKGQGVHDRLCKFSSLSLELWPPRYRR
jgi:hypothetical protein